MLPSLGAGECAHSNRLISSQPVDRADDFAVERLAIQADTTDDRLSRIAMDRKRSNQMPESEIGNAMQLLDLMLEFFTDDAHWTRGRYDDGHGGHCLVGALLHLSREHRLPSAPAIALLQDAMPRPGLPLVHFNDSRCGTVAELRSVIIKARRLAHDTAERERAAAAVKAWLLAQIEKKQAATATADIEKSAPEGLFGCDRLAA